MFRAKTIFAAALVLCPAFAGSLPAGADTPATPAAEPPSAKEFYSAALKTMRELPQPPYVAYRLEGEADGLQIWIRVINHLVWLNISGGSMPSRWDLHHRTDDYSSEIVDTMNHDFRYITQRSFFDPTWYGSYRALRDGMLGYQDVEAPVSSYATPGPSEPSTLKTIAVEKVMGPSIYDVQDAGTATCSNGDPGHALHLVPIERDPRRQLTDVVVDIRSMRFCSIRYSWTNGDFHGVVEQHYADVGGWWMQTDGSIDGTLKSFGISMHRGVWRYQLTGMTFPRTLPAAAFVPDPWQ